MVKKQLLGFFAILLAGIAAIVWVFWQSESIAMLNPKGWIAEKERHLMIASLALMLIVVIPVFILTFFIAWRYRAGNAKAKYAPDWDHSTLAECIWWGLPFIIIVILSVMTWRSSHSLDPFKPIESEKPPLTIQVVALQWKWLFIYPENNIATVNFARIPEKTPIRFEVSADAPMNSFWVPQLGGQIYAMAGMVSQLNLIADEPGIFHGSSANISGKGFSGMSFTIEATDEKAFNDWVDTVKKSAATLGEQEYDLLAKPSAYNSQASYILNKNDLFDHIVMKPMQKITTEKL